MSPARGIDEGLVFREAVCWPALQVLYDEAGEGVNPVITLIETGNIVKALPPDCKKLALPSMAISSSVSRQSDANPGQMTSTRSVRCLPRSDSVGAVYG